MRGWSCHSRTLISEGSGNYYNQTITNRLWNKVRTEFPSSEARYAFWYWLIIAVKSFLRKFFACARRYIWHICAVGRVTALYCTEINCPNINDAFYFAVLLCRLKAIGLEQFENAELFDRLMMPVAFMVVIILQMHYFHEPFLKLSSLDRYRYIYCLFKLVYLIELTTR